MGLEFYWTPGLSGTANSHWLMSHLQSGKAGTLPSASLMWGAVLWLWLRRSCWNCCALIGPARILGQWRGTGILCISIGCMPGLSPSSHPTFFFGGTEERGAGNEPRVAMADTSFLRLLLEWRHWNYGNAKWRGEGEAALDRKSSLCGFQTRLG